MFGTFRLLLALLVLLTHSGLNAGHFLPGTMAVIGFYAISGYVISFLLEHRLEAVTARTFYLERIVRVYPQFVLHLAISIAVILAFHPNSPFAKAPVTLETVALNLSLFPLQAKAFSETIASALYVPTSWSLSLEASFYLVVPFLVRYRLLVPAALASFAVFALAVLGVIATHTFSYATIFGTLQFFVVGMWIEQRKHVFLCIWAAAMLMLAVLVQMYASWRPSHVEETFAGAALILIAVPLLARLRNKQLLPIDDFFGRISYPVFLNHFILMWSMDAFRFDYHTLTGRSTLVALSLVMGAVTYLVAEKPLATFRRSLRQTANSRSAHPPGAVFTNNETLKELNADARSPRV